MRIWRTNQNRFHQFACQVGRDIFRFAQGGSGNQQPEKGKVLGLFRTTYYLYVVEVLLHIPGHLANAPCIPEAYGDPGRIGSQSQHKKPGLRIELRRSAHLGCAKGGDKLFVVLFRLTLRWFAEQVGKDALNFVLLLGPENRGGVTNLQ
jgi:hypothetical protein